MAYIKSLPPEGRAGGNSIFVACATVMLANRCLGEKLNVNSACISLMKRFISDNQKAEDLFALRAGRASAAVLRGVESKSQMQGIGIAEGEGARLSI
jgi:hypothetical protein